MQAFVLRDDIRVAMTLPHISLVDSYTRFSRRTLGGKLGRNHVIGHQVNRTVATLLTA